MRRIVSAAAAVALVVSGSACTEAELAELDSASACLDAASADLDVLEAERIGHSGVATLRAKARRLNAECDAATRRELDIKSGGH